MKLVTSMISKCQIVIRQVQNCYSTEGMIHAMLTGSGRTLCGSIGHFSAYSEMGSLKLNFRKHLYCHDVFREVVLTFGLPEFFY